MVDYVEEFQALGSRFGIEDQEAPGDHFFSDHYKSGKRKRFAAWVGGAGVGQADTIEEARLLLKEYLSRVITRRIDQINAEIEMIKEAIDALQETTPTSRS